MTRDEELTQLRNRIASSQRLGDGYADRVKAIQKRIDELTRGTDANPL